MKIVYQTEDERYRVDRSRKRLVSGGIEITEWFPSRRFASEGVAIDHACQITEETGYAARVVDTRPERDDK